MVERVDARDVMDANAHTTRGFRANVLGHFRRTGPNSWDDYAWVADLAESIEVTAGIPVQLERRGVEVRLRRRGKVFRVRWDPEPETADLLRGAQPEAIRAYFIEHFLEIQGAPPGIGTAAFVAQKLTR
ncbi:MAG: hypothetical protein JW751_24455 [Polyangiaceae bacterium]|nr:hypothetical protein [Polyangiaceae bacterium]